jgi:hypothetical protein
MDVNLLRVLSIALVAGREAERLMFQNKCEENAALQELVKVRFDIHALIDSYGSPKVARENNVNDVAGVVKGGGPSDISPGGRVL